MYIIRGGDPPTDVDLDHLGLNEESLTHQGRSNTRELSDGTYLVRAQGLASVTRTLNGEYLTATPEFTAMFRNLASMVGSRVELLEDDQRIGFAVLRSLNPTRQNRVGKGRFAKRTWRLDLEMEHPDVPGIES